MHPCLHIHISFIVFVIVTHIDEDPGLESKYLFLNLYICPQCDLLVSREIVYTYILYNRRMQGLVGARAIKHHVYVYMHAYICLYI